MMRARIQIHHRTLRIGRGVVRRKQRYIRLTVVVIVGGEQIGERMISNPADLEVIHILVRPERVISRRHLVQDANTESITVRVERSGEIRWVLRGETDILPSISTEIRQLRWIGLSREGFYI